MNAAQHHAISYIEFGVTDLDATKAFYQEAFGWEKIRASRSSGNRLGVYADK